MARRVWLLLIVLLTVCPVLEAQILPSGPSKFVDTTYPVMTGATINVPAGGDFQAALNQAQLGDTIVLQAGATYSGSFTLNPKSGSGWILIRTSAPDSSLPAQGHRITPSYASALPKIVATSSAPAIQVARSAHHYRFVGLEITVASSVSLNYGLVALGDDSTSTSSQIPTNLVLDRVYIHGLPNNNLRRGVAMNSATSAVIDSYISEVHEAGADSQAICGWNGPGPFKISNDYLEAAGENVLFGGADPAVTNLVPSDIEVRGNYFFKPVSWQTASWTVKNIFELKNAQRVIADGNIFEHNWPAAQNGFSILFTVRNQDGSAPWSVVQDITFTHNIVRHVAAAVNILGTDDIHPSQQTKRVLVANNLFVDVSGVNWGGSGRLFQILDGVANLTIDHNTAFQTGEVIAAAGPADTAFTYRNNLSPNNQYGVAGDNYYGNPLGTLATYFPGAVFLKNILQGGDPSKYPPNNFFPATMNDVGFVNFSGGDYHLAAGSAYKNAGTDGRDVGADIDSVNSATAGAISGNSGSPPPPDTTPPSVAITAPANGATVASTVTVSANASDNVGVAGVQFYVDGATLGAEDTASPYSVSWDTTRAANGSHTLTAIARDAAGNRTTSAAVNVTVSNAAPAESPYYGTPFTVPGSFNAVDFDKGGEGVAYHDNTPGNQGGFYRTTEDVDIINPSPGVYVVNNFETSEWLNYTINVTASGTYKIEAQVSSMFSTSQFHVSIDGVDKTGLITAPNTGLWTTFQWVGKDGISLTAGQHILRITADLQYFNFEAMRITASTPPPDTTPPTVAITAPANGATVSATVTVSANASDNVGVAGVQFYVDGATLGAEDTAGPYSVSWDTTSAANGSHTLTAIARDAAGNRTTSATVTVTVSNTIPDTTPPTVAITAPANGATVSATVSVSANASDNVGVAGVQFYVDGATLGAEDTASPYSVSWDTTSVANGSHALTAIARDAAGNRTTSATVTVTVSNTTPDTTPPTVAITAPAAGATVSATVNVSANASDNVGVAGVQFYVDGTTLGAEDTATPYSVSWDTTRVANGAHALTAVARDAAGNRTTSAAVSVTVSNATAGRLPYYGTPFQIPGTFQAEDFDKGGEGVAYHDNTPGNQGGYYRLSEDVDIISPYAGGYVVNNFETGEWMEYTINVASSGTYSIEALVSSMFSNSQFHVSIDGVDKTGLVNAPNTGLWTTFQWIGKSGISLAAGQHILRLTADVQYFNVDAMRITAITINRSPYYGTPFQIPGTFQAEDFDKGGEGAAYHDNTPGNQGGLYRTTEDVDIISPYAGGYVVNNFETGEWMEYTINVTGSANYRIEALVSSTYSNSQWHVSIDGVDKTGLVTTPNTGLWTTFQWVGIGGISLAAGQHILRLSADVQYANVDALRITQEVAPATPTPADTTPPAVTLTAPVNGAIVSSIVQVTATASDDVGVAGVQFYLDGMALGSETTAVPYSISWDTATAANALHTLTAVARDAAGNRTTSGAVQVTVTNIVPDTTAPAVSITAPMNGGIVSGTVQVTASASDNIGVAGVQFYLDGTALGSEATATPYSVSWNTTTVANASHTLTAVARDAAGNRTTSGAIQVTVNNGVPDTTSPTVAIIAPTNGATVSGTTQVTATASDNVGVVGLQLYLDGAALGAEGTAAAYSVSWDTTAAANGSHTLTAVARDAAGNRATSAPVTVTVSNSAARKRPGRH